MNGVIISINPNGSGLVHGFNPNGSSAGNFFFGPGQLMGPAHPGANVTFGLQQVLGPFGRPVVVAVNVQPIGFSPDNFVSQSMAESATVATTADFVGASDGGPNAGSPSFLSGDALLLAAQAAEAAARAAQAAAEAALVAAQSLQQIAAATAGSLGSDSQPAEESQD